MRRFGETRGFFTGKTLRIDTKDATLLSPTPSSSNPFVSTRAPVIDLTVPSIPTHAKFTQGVYTVLADRWFGRGRVLSMEQSTGFTAPLLDLLPHEQAQVQIGDDGLLRNARIVAESLQNPSPWRQKPPCPHASVCPGCTLQHVTLHGRDDYQRALIAEVLQRFGGFTPEELPAIQVRRGKEGDHRMRTKLWLRPNLFSADENADPSRAKVPDETRSKIDAWQVGMRQRGAKDAPLVDFSACLANAVILRQSAQRLQTLSLDARAWQKLPAKDQWVEFAWDAHTLWMDASAWPDVLQQQALLHMQTSKDIGHLVQAAATDAPWTPVNPPMQQALYDAIFESMDMRGKKIFDLTCADGGLTFALAERGAEVWASDRHWPAVERTRAQAEARGMTNVHTRGGNAEAVLNGAMRRNEPVDVLVINPMREPMGEQTMLSAHQSGARDLFYLAPAPKAGAKDLTILRKLGWTILRSDAFVLHPWTGQSMLFAWMRKSS